MSTPQPFPHASLLAYFRQPAGPTQVIEVVAPPPPYSDRPIRQEPTSANAYTEEDEESNCGFFDQAAACKPMSMTCRRTKHGHRRFLDICCLWIAVLLCSLVAFGAFLALDLFSSQYGLSTGVARWMINGGNPSSQLAYEVSYNESLSGQ
jgi:hypothetical protein